MAEPDFASPISYRLLISVVSRFVTGLSSSRFIHFTLFDSKHHFSRLVAQMVLILARLVRYN
jgi:hypothetical protein